MVANVHVTKLILVHLTDDYDYENYYPLTNLIWFWEIVLIMCYKLERIQ